MTDSFGNALRMEKAFTQSQQPQKPEQLNYDPPRKVWDKNMAMVPTPMGTIDVEIVQELDHTAQRAIQQAQRQPDEFEQRMQQRFEQSRKRSKGPRR